MQRAISSAGGMRYRCPNSAPMSTNTACYNVYLWDGNIQVPLPLIVYNETDNELWEKKISCDFAVGSVAVYYQENDFMNEGYRPEDMTFRIHLVW